MASFQHNLPVGMPRGAVQNYLDSHNVQYTRVRFGGDESDRFQILVGKEPGSFVCEEREVYVALQFSRDDRLKMVDIHRMGACL